MNKKEMTQFVTEKYSRIINMAIKEKAQELESMAKAISDEKTRLSIKYRKMFLEEAVEKGIYNKSILDSDNIRFVSQPEFRYIRDEDRFSIKNESYDALEKEITSIRKALAEERDAMLESILIFGIKDKSVKEALIALSIRAKGE